MFSDGSELPISPSVPAGDQAAAKISPGSSASRSGRPPRTGISHACGSSLTRASGRGSATNAIRSPSGDQAASKISYVGSLSRFGLPPRTETTQSDRNSSRIPSPSRRHVRSSIRRASGFSRSPTTNRGSPLGASRRIRLPSGDHSARAHDRLAVGRDRELLHLHLPQEVARPEERRLWHRVNLAQTRGNFSRSDRRTVET